ncbi:hypothetical protein WICPIJ_008044 [Wickerhamomyces pijperi]|uniref:MARVEL domain-containing protein n=1 Tax=Wickerhamomyces pijperi TaxID=599730 RepID=A0A9P8TJC4_WICPI|nr:hypothetical protein WICPIJ_008044 [Wickerhamomyces pijperi]
MQNDYHDQSTVTSPTNDHLHEKQYGAAGDGVSSSQATGIGKFTSNFTWQVVLRVLEFLNAVTLIGVASSSLSKFYEGEPRMRYTVFVAAFTLLYLIVHTIMGFVWPKFVLSGPILICEVLLVIGNLSAFIAIAARYSGYSCNYQQFDQYGYRYNTDVSIPGCHSAKAAIAFAAFGFLLFALSLLTFGYNVLRSKYAQARSNFGTLFNHTTSSQGGYFINYPFLDFRDNFQASSASAYAGDQHTVGGDLENQTGQYATQQTNTGAAAGYNSNNPNNYQRPNEPPATTTVQDDSGYTGTTNTNDNNTYSRPEGAPTGANTSGDYSKSGEGYYGTTAGSAGYDTTTGSTGYKQAGDTGYNEASTGGANANHGGYTSTTGDWKNSTTGGAGYGASQITDQEGNYADRVQQIKQSGSDAVGSGGLEKPKAAYQKATSGF